LEKLAAARQRRWEKQRAYLFARSRFYRRLWEERRPPRRLGEISGLPFTAKAMLRESQDSAPPFGDYLAAEPGAVRRVHRTSGTTGKAMNTALSVRDAAITAETGGRALAAAGLGPGHVVVNCLNYQLWMGGFTDHTTLEATGATVVPFGVGGSGLLLRTIRELGISAIYCTPSYPAVLERVMVETFPDLKPAGLGLRLGLLTGEAGLENPAFRARVEAIWGFTARNVYGISDVLTTVAAECAHGHALHLVCLDVLHAELIEPESGEPVAWRDGARGELVLTHLARECQPLVRFRTADIIRIETTEPCACGRTAPRISVLGRSDDMVVVRGVNVFPGDVAAVVNRFEELSGEFLIRLVGPGPYHRLPVEAELAPGGEGGRALAEAIAREIRAAARASAEVTLVPADTLPRSESKTKRVIRESSI
jgi:phenylacetate-CoA ligase